MPNPFFDAVKYPWHLELARTLHQFLYVAIKTHVDITHYFNQSSPDVTPLAEGSPDQVWIEALDKLTRAQALEALCERLLEQAELAVLHECVRQVKAAETTEQIRVLSSDRIFLNRQDLRARLTKLGDTSTTTPVLLIDGERGAGNSWTQELAQLVAKDRGAKYTYIFDGSVATAKEVVSKLFAVLGEASIPAQDETDSAWYRKVCIDLQRVATKIETETGIKETYWIVVDDIGDYRDGEVRLSKSIRDFFDQLVVNLYDDAMAKYFRLVLIDYPPGPKPTKWKNNWATESPANNDVNAEDIVSFLREWASKHDKSISENDASELANSIINQASEPTVDIASRLRTINESLTSSLLEIP